MKKETLAGIKLTEWPISHAEELTVVKTHVVLGSMMFAFTLTKVELMMAEELPNGSPACAIVHNDRNVICFTEDGFTKFCKTSQERAFVLIHELFHVFFQHHNRRIDMNYHPLIWNYATDYYINLKVSGIYTNQSGAILNDERYRKHFSAPRNDIGESNMLYDEKYVNMTCDEIYDSLVQDMEKNKDNPDAQPIDMSGYNGADDMGENGSLSDIIGNGGTEEKKRENTQTLAGAATASKMGMSDNDWAGSAEGSMIRMVEAMMKPVIPWTDKFENAIRSNIKTRTTYNKWNKMSAVGDGIIFPTYTGETVNLVYGVDSSGSMTQDAHAEARGELYGLLDSLDGWTVSVACCDTQLHDMGTFSNEDGDEFDDIQFKMQGLGGTSLSPLLDYADRIENDTEEVSAVVIVTDGYFDGSELDTAIKKRGDNVPVIVVIVRDGDQTFRMNNAEVIFVK